MWREVFMGRIWAWYFRSSLMFRMFGGFFLGASIGFLVWWSDARHGLGLAAWVGPIAAPFGAVFVNMLKMVVIPIVFFSLIFGAASLPLRRFGRVGAKVVGWYFFTSLLAAVVGVILAVLLNPGGGVDVASWQDLARGVSDQTEDALVAQSAGQGLVQILVGVFQNPFQALAEGNFLPVIVFAILFGIATRSLLDREDSPEALKESEGLNRMMSMVDAIRIACFRMVDWIMEYAPIGVFALSIGNFSLYGPSIMGPYVKVVLGVILAILAMIGGVYSLLVWAVLRENPLPLFGRLRPAMVTAFLTRSSAATLPVSIKTAEENLHLHNEVASFSLPLGATINMDGVCVHLPMFGVLAANMCGLELSMGQLLVMVLTTVLAAVGAGGVPGGSLMLLFIILETMGLAPDQVAVVVALALGVNPILDMFETMNNVTGDLVCTYVVARREGLFEEPAVGD
jgi:Na+/H+-dicarboxylate symporter